MNEAHIFSKYGGTRFVLTMGCCVLNTLLLTWGASGEATYQLIILATVGAYITGNTVQNATSVLTNAGSPQADILLRQHIFNKYGGTRFLLAMGCCVMNTYLLGCGNIGEATYQVLILGTVGAYITGNTIQNAASFIANRGSQQ